MLNSQLTNTAIFSLLAALSLAACSENSSPPAAFGSGGGNSTGDVGEGTDGAGSGGDSSGGDSSTGSGGEGRTGVYEPGSVSPFIVVDQFGYLEDSEKIAVLRDPQTGFDAEQSYMPSSQYQLIETVGKTPVLELTAAVWNAGAAHTQSGDKAYWLDFSTFNTPGEYYILDVESGVRSDTFSIGPDVYREVLRHALRTFFYQRAGFAKEAPFAEEGWTDGASHLGAGQDKNARLFGQTADDATERDLSGGWYDAGDYNRYTAWSADYITTMLRMYQERPEAFGDDLNIPESGNGQADILDEVLFGLDQLKRTQSETGGCVSVLGTDPQYETASPPSKLKAAAVYGPETTNATIRAGIAFAWAARLFAESEPEGSADLLTRAELAWTFASANPDLEFENTGKIAAGEQQASASEVVQYKLGLAIALYAAGGDVTYKEFFETNYAAADIQFLKGYSAGWQVQFTEFCLDYAALADADPTIKEEILTAYRETMTSDENFGMIAQNPDPYLAFVDTYTWGSNAHKSRTGCLFYDNITFGIEPAKDADARTGAERYIHYLHGVNPLGLVYLTNMGKQGAYKSINTIYHSWYADGSALWDEVGISTYGPPPGFLSGGPNPGYELDASCPDQTGCPAVAPSPPTGQPDQKSYLDFNAGWPVNSWAVTENSNGYQVYYLRLLSKFVH